VPQSTQKTLRRLVEKYSGKPLTPLGAAPPMSQAELEAALEWADDRCAFPALKGLEVIFLSLRSSQLSTSASICITSPAKQCCVDLL